MPHRLRHGPTVYNGHLRGPVTLTFGSGAATLCFYDLGLSRPGIPVICYLFITVLCLQFRCGFCPGNVLGVVNLLAV